MTFDPSCGKNATLTPEAQSALATRIAAGDPGAEEEFVAAFQERVFVMLLTRVRDREAARDLVQEVLLAALKSLRQSQVRQTENLAGFVFGTARNLANNHIRSRLQQKEEPLEWEFPVAAAEEGPEMAERLERVHLALNQMEGMDRKVLLMTLVEGLKPGAIGERLGLSSDVVRQRKSRALKRIIEKIQGLSQIRVIPPRLKGKLP